MKEATKIADVTAQWRKGAKVLLVEYRKGIAERISWRDKATGRSMSGAVLRHIVETQNDSVIVSERVPEDFNVEGYVSPYKKGAMVALWVTEVVTERGVVTARGEIQPVLDGATG